MSTNRISIRLKQAACIAALAAAAGTCIAGDPYAGEAKAQVCLACHGVGDTTTGAGTPIIAGQYEDYIAQALRDYQSGARSNAVMSGFVASLTETDIRDLAAYYASLESKLFTPTNH